MKLSQSNISVKILSHPGAWMSSETFQPNKKKVRLPWLNFQTAKAMYIVQYFIIQALDVIAYVHLLTHSTACDEC